MLIKVMTDLHEAIEAVAPIDGVSIGDAADKDTWHIDFRSEATPSQRKAAADVIAAFNIAAASEPTAQDVKAEAARRIEAIMPDYEQRNVLAFGLETIMTYGADPSQWPEPLQQVNADMQAKWGAIKAIRVRSDEIEAMDPIPTDFRDDSYW